MIDEESIHLERINGVVYMMEMVKKMPFTSRYFYYPYIIHVMSELISEYELLCETIKGGIAFDLWRVIGIDYNEFRSAIRKISEISNPEIKEMDREMFLYFSNKEFNSEMVYRVMLGTKEYNDDQALMCSNEVCSLLTQVERVRNLTEDFEECVNILIRKFIKLLIKIDMLIWKCSLKKEQAMDMMDFLLGLKWCTVGNEADYVMASQPRWNTMLGEYYNDLQGYIDGYTKDDLLNRELYKFIRKIIDSGFFRYLSLGSLHEAQSSKLWGKVCEKEELKGLENEFKQFNYLFAWNGNRYELDKVATVKYILNFRKDFKCEEVLVFLDFCEVLTRIYEDVDGLLKVNNVKKNHVLDSIMALVASMDKDGLLSEADRDRLQYFFEELLKDEKNRYRGYIVKKMRGNRNVKCWIGDVSSAPLLMLFGVLSREGTLDLSDKDIQEWWMRKASNMSEDTYSRYFNGGKNETEPWTEGGSKAKENSEGTYEYIVSVAKEMMKINNKGK